MAGTGFSFSSTSSSSSSSFPKPSSSSSAPFGFGCGTISSTTASPFGASDIFGSSTQASEITGKTVEEIIKEWNAELQERSGEFCKHSNAVAEWDQRILQNRDILLRLESDLAKVVDTQGTLEQQLELIETHQDEVDKALQSIEDEAERMYREERGLLLDDDAASTRDAMYEQSELIERELEQMKEHIKSIINTLNANQSKEVIINWSLNLGGELEAADGMDCSPMDFVVRILNNQLSSLMLIDEKTEEFSSRIQKLGSSTPSLFGASSAASASNASSLLFGSGSAVTSSIFGSSTPATSASTFGSGIDLNTSQFGSSTSGPTAPPTATATANISRSSGGAPCSPMRWRVGAPGSPTVIRFTRHTFKNPFFEKCSFFWGIEEPTFVLGVRNQNTKEICGALTIQSILYSDLVMNEGSSHVGSVNHLLNEVPKKFPSKLSDGVTNANLCPEDILKFVKLYGMEVHGEEGKIFVEDYFHLQPANEEDSPKIQEITDQLSKQPLAALIFAPPTFLSWQPGVGNSIYCGPTESEMYDISLTGYTEPLHAVTLLGYGSEFGIDYYIFQNSYGVDWGIKGYGKIKRSLVKQAWWPVGTYFGKKKKQKKGKQQVGVGTPRKKQRSIRMEE